MIQNPNVFMKNIHMSLNIFNKLYGLLKICLLLKRDAVRRNTTKS